MLTRFHKMHGLGNDFVIFDAREAPVKIDGKRARALADRNRGVGCDQLILLNPSDEADAAMAIFNADGSEAEACGNAARCVASLIGAKARIATPGGMLLATREGERVAITLPPPRLAWQDIPLALAMDTADMPVSWDALARPAAVNVGNPHLTFFVPDCDAVDLAAVGPTIATDPLFPEGINVHVATIADRGRIRMRSWERGAGLTHACGTGACATAVAAIRGGLADADVTVALPGGELAIAWSGDQIRMTGAATHVFTGEIDLETLA